MTPIVLRIRALRERQGLSQSALAKLLHVRQATISEWETGSKRRLDLDLLERLADILGVAPAALLDVEREAPHSKAARKPRSPRKP